MGKWPSNSSQGFQGCSINESDYLLETSIPIISLKSYPTLTTLNQIDLGHESNYIDDQLDEHNIGRDINDPEKDSLKSYRTVQSNLTK